jgi:hypothetical protein
VREDLFESADRRPALSVQGLSARQVVESEDLSRPPARELLVNREERRLLASVVGLAGLLHERRVALRRRCRGAGSGLESESQEEKNRHGHLLCDTYEPRESYLAGAGDELSGRA